MTRVMRKTSEKRTVVNLFSAMQRWTERRLPRPQPPLRPRSPDTENDGVGVKMEASAPHRSTALASSLPAPDHPHLPSSTPRHVRLPIHPGGLHAPFHCRSWSVSPVVLRGSPDVPSPSVARVSPPRCRIQARPVQMLPLPGVHYHSISTTWLSTPLPGGFVRATSQSAVEF